MLRKEFPAKVSFKWSLCHASQLAKGSPDQPDSSKATLRIKQRSGVDNITRVKRREASKTHDYTGISTMCYFVSSEGDDMDTE